jgi:23S rRNA (guanosine2251-2'-O)-methyltransferase
LKKLSLHELHRISSNEFINKQKTPILFCADQIRSGHNIGSLFRIADAFAMEGIILSNYCVKPPHPEIEKTALGATQTVCWHQSENLVEELQKLKSEGFQLIGIEQTDESIPLNEFEVREYQKYILILGHEINGISQEVLNICDYSLEIPQFGTKHSLNVSVAAGIVAWNFAGKTLGYRL